MVALLALATWTSVVAEDYPVTEFKRDDQIVKIVLSPMLKVRAAMTPIINEKINGKVRARNKLGGEKNYYWFRTRSIEGRLQCEKFAVLPPKSTEEEIAARAEELFRESCS